METLSNSSAQIQQQSNYSNASLTLSLQTSVYQAFLRDLQQIKGSRSYSSNQYLDGNAYCILFSTELKFYFPDSGKVVKIWLPADFEVTSAKHIFLFEAQPQILGINGYLVVAFGLNSYSLIHIDNQYTEASNLGYRIVWVRPYQNIQAANNRECLHLAKLGELKNTMVARSSFPQQEITFFLGAASQQKVVQVKICLRSDPEGSVNRLSSILTSSEEILVHQEAKTLKNRFSQFISTKLGYAGLNEEEGESSGCVKALEIYENFVFVVTNKDVFIIRRVDQAKIFEKEYSELIKEWALRQDRIQNPQVMRELLEYRLLSVSSAFITNPQTFTLNVVVLRTQALQTFQGDQYIKITQLVHKPFLFQVDQTQTHIQEKEDNSVYFFYDVTNFSKDGVRKAFSLTYDIPRIPETSEIGLLIGVEFNDGKTVAIEHLLSSSVESMKETGSTNLLGYNAQVYSEVSSGEPVVKIVLISQNDVETYEFIATTSCLSQIMPQSLSGALQAQIQGPILSKPHYPVEEDQQRIVRRDQLKPLIYSLLEKVATYLYAPENRSEELRSKLSEEIKQSILLALSQVSKGDFLTELKDIIREAIDLQINDSHFQNVNSSLDSFRLIFNDDGLILTSLENKSKKIEVIEQFLFTYLISRNQDEQDIDDLEILQLIQSLSFNQKMAESLRNIQEQMKEDLRTSEFQRSVNSSIGHSQNQFNRVLDFPLGMRLLFSVVQISSKKLNFPEDQLRALGITSSTVVYSTISQFDKVLKNMIEICLDSNPRQFIELNHSENQQSLNFEAVKILNLIFEDAISTNGLITQNSFFNDSSFLQLVTGLSERFTDEISEQDLDMKIQLEKIADQFMIIARALNKEGSDDYSQWLTNFILQLEKAISKEKALEFAEKYEAPELLCRLVFELGREKYDFIHRNVNNWGSEFLELAIENFYYLEKNQVKVPSQNGSYSFQMFEVFEELYYPQLKQFIAQKNKKLLTLLNLRHGESEQANEALRAEVIPQIQNVQTMKVFSSLAVTNLEHCIDDVSTQFKMEEVEYYSSKLSIAQVQSQVLPDQEKLLPSITVQYLEQTLLKLNEQNPQAQDQSLRSIMRLNNDEKADSQANTQELKQYAWSTLLTADLSSIRNIQASLPREGELNLYTEQQIKDLIEQTLLYQVASENFGKPSQLDQDVQMSLLEQQPDLKDSLNQIFSLLRSRNPGQLFSNQLGRSSNQMLIS